MANSDDEIIEKRDASPLATACLVLASVGLLGSIGFQMAEMAEVRAASNKGKLNAAVTPGMTPEERRQEKPHEFIYKKNIDELKKQVDDLVAQNLHPEIKVEMPPEGTAKEGEGADANDGKGEEKPDEKAEAPPAKSVKGAAKAPPAAAARKGAPAVTVTPAAKGAPAKAAAKKGEVKKGAEPKKAEAKKEAEAAKEGEEPAAAEGKDEKKDAAEGDAKDSKDEKESDAKEEDEKK